MVYQRHAAIIGPESKNSLILLNNLNIVYPINIPPLQNGTKMLPAGDTVQARIRDKTIVF